MVNIKQINIKIVNITFSMILLILNRQKIRQKYWHLKHWKYYNKKNNDIKKY